MSEGFNQLVQARFGKMLINKNDQYVGRSLSVYGEYSWGEIDILERLFKAGDTVIEVGSNIGSHTVPLSQRLGPNGVLYAFEPQRLVFQLLSANIALNDCANVHAHWQGVGAESGSIRIAELSPHQFTNFGGIEAGVEQGNDVPLTTIDSLNLESCALIKADVEGMEVEVVQGAKETLKRCRPNLYLEADRRDKLPQLLQLLFDADYKIYWHIPPLFNADNAFDVKEDIFNIISINIICLPKESTMSVQGFLEVTSVNDWPR